MTHEHAGGDVRVGNGACVAVALYPDGWYTLCGTVCVARVELFACIVAYRGADKSLARPGRKQARKHVKDTRDFNNMETRAVINFFFPARQGAEGN